MTDQKEKTKNAIAGFEPSTGEEDYLNPKPTKKELAERAASDPVTLPGLAEEINNGYQQGEVMRQQTCAQFIKVGLLLNVARTKFTSNTKFGTWRKKSINFSQSHVQRLMSVAKEFGDIPDAALVSFGTLAVLTSASDDLKDKVIADAKDGVTTKRAEVIDKKAEEKDSPPESAADAAADMESSGKEETVEPASPPLEEWEKAQATMAVNFNDRLALLDPIGGNNPVEHAFMIFGIPPFHDGWPSHDCLFAFYDWNMGKMDDEKDAVLMNKLTAAYDLLVETCHA